MCAVGTFNYALIVVTQNVCNNNDKAGNLWSGTSQLPARCQHRMQTLPPVAWDWWLIRQQPESQRSTLISQPPTSSSPLRWRTWGLSMLQHWISSVIWASESVTFPETTRETQFLFQRTRVTIQRFNSVL